MCEVDLRVGGRWRFVNRHPKGDAEFYGVYREITPTRGLQPPSLPFNPNLLREFAR